MKAGTLDKVKDKYPWLVGAIKKLIIFFASLVFAGKFLIVSTFSISGVSEVADFSLTAMMIFGLLNIILFQKKDKKLMLPAGIFCIMYILYMITKTDLFLTYSLFSVYTYGLFYRDVIKRYVTVTVFLILASVLASFIGLIPNLIYFMDGHLRDSFGICYPTDFNSYLFYTLLLFWIGWNTLPHIITIILNVPLFIVAWRFTDSDTCMICAVVFVIVLIGFIISEYFKNRKQDFRHLKKVIDWILILSFPVFTLTMLGLIFLYANETQIGVKINDWLTGRLGLAWESIKLNGITFLGTKIPQLGNGNSTFLPISGYDFVDSTYPLLLIRYGLIFYAIACLLWMRMTYRSIKAGDYRLAFGMFLVAFHSLAEHHFVEINYNILLFIPFAEIKLKDEGVSVYSEDKQKDIYKKTKQIAYVFCSIIVIIFLLSPMWLSALRTIVDYTGAADNPFFRIMFIISLGIVIWATILIVKGTVPRLLPHETDEKFKKTRIRYLITGISILVIYIITGFVLTDRAEKDTLVSRQFDSEAIKLISNNSQGNIYAKKYSSLYVKDYEKICRSVLYGEDLARYKNITVITDVNDELYIFPRTGFSYAPISEYSAIYTNDQSVIDILDSSGYMVTDYFSGTKIQNVDHFQEGMGLRTGTYEVKIKVLVSHLPDDEKGLKIGNNYCGIAYAAYDGGNEIIELVSIPYVNKLEGSFENISNENEYMTIYNNTEKKLIEYSFTFVISQDIRDVRIYTNSASGFMVSLVDARVRQIAK